MIRCGLILTILLARSLPALAQDPPPAPAAGGAEFFPGFDFHLTAEHLAHDDPRFVWEANFGGELDVVSFRATRARFIANYQVVMGEQFRAFDPNQGNYILSGDAPTRVGMVEVGPVFYHQSRHLSDRFKRQSVDWNMLGGMVGTTVERGETHMEARADLRGTVHATYVDYTWELDTRARITRRLNPHVVVLGGGSLRVLGVDGSQNRGTQTGFRADGGVGFDGRGGSLELFVAVERRIDPYQLEFGTATWASVGLRLLSR